MRLDRVADHRLQVKVYIDQSQGLGRNLLRLSSHQRQRVAHIAHALSNPDQARPIFDHQAMIVLTWDILGGQYSNHAGQLTGFLCIDAFEDSVWDPCALDRGVQHALEIKIIGELRYTGHLFYRIGARLERADDFMGWRFFEEGKLRRLRQLASAH